MTGGSSLAAVADSCTLWPDSDRRESAGFVGFARFPTGLSSPPARRAKVTQLRRLRRLGFLNRLMPHPARISGVPWLCVLLHGSSSPPVRRAIVTQLRRLRLGLLNRLMFHPSALCGALGTVVGSQCPRRFPRAPNLSPDLLLCVSHLATPARNVLRGHTRQTEFVAGTGNFPARLPRL